jgi:hypothetical protein
MVGSGGTTFWWHDEIKTHKQPDFVPPGRQNQMSFCFYQSVRRIARCGLLSVNSPKTEGKKIA